LVKEAQALVEQGRLPQAKQKYRQGLRCLMITMPDTPQDGSEMSASDKLHLQVISDYMTEMEALDSAGSAAGAGSGKGGTSQHPSTSQGGMAMGGNDDSSAAPGGCKGARGPTTYTAWSGKDGAATHAGMPAATSKALPLPRPVSAASAGAWEGKAANGAESWEGAMAKSGGCSPWEGAAHHGF